MKRTSATGRRAGRWAVAALAVALSLPAISQAHDFWIQPDAYRAIAGVPVRLTMWVGHGADRQKWAVASSRLLKLFGRSANGDTDYRNTLPSGPITGEIDLQFNGSGLQIIALESGHASSELPAIRFNDYVEKEGLTPAREHRERTGMMGTPGREIYSRRAKALIQVDGAAAGDAALATASIGLTLEIVPVSDPFAADGGAQLPVRVLYEGAPLGGALVKLTNLDFDSHSVAEVRTDDSGTAVFQTPGKGKWLFNVVWTKPIAGNPEAEFETVFSSLTLEFAAGHSR